jgi:hypothetical protein
MHQVSCSVACHTPTCLTLCSTLYLMHSLFQDWNIHYIILRICFWMEFLSSTLYLMHSLFRETGTFVCSMYTPVTSKKSAKRCFTSRQTPQPLNGIVAIINCSNPLLSLVTHFMDTSVEYSWAQTTMKSVVSELSLGVIDFALSVFALVSMFVSSSGHCINTILFSHIALGILCLFSRNVKL